MIVFIYNDLMSVLKFFINWILGRIIVYILFLYLKLLKDLIRLFFKIVFCLIDNY